MNKHIMKDPADLDVFDGEQPDITREMDTNPGVLNRICSPIAARIHNLEVAVWQRWCFEAEMTARQKGATEDEKVAAKLTWILVKAIQEIDALAEEAKKREEPISFAG